jgi:phosphate:Na+ symporter
MFKAIGCALAVPFLGFYIPVADDIQALGFDAVVSFHFLFNVLLSLSMVMFTGQLGEWLTQYLPANKVDSNKVQPKYLDPTALSTPSLAIACAAREALHQADVVETMLRGIVPVIQNDDAELAAKLREMDDGVDDLYSAIKFYLTQISREALSQREGQRWADIMSFAINMEQVGDIIERVLQDIEDKKIAKGRKFSEAGFSEIEDLHQRLVASFGIWNMNTPAAIWRACKKTPRKALAPVLCTSI